MIFSESIDEVGILVVLQLITPTSSNLQLSSPTPTLISNSNSYLQLLTMKAIDRIGSAFLRRILRRMKELGVSQTELARRMNVSRPYITKVLRQDVNFSFRTAAKLANALKMDFMPELRPQEVGVEVPA